MLYCAIIGDIVNSRKLKDRELVQIQFRHIIDAINKQYNNYIASKFTITLGDEFQGLLNDSSISYEIVKEIKTAMSPIQLVFGVGIGNMSTDFNREISIGSDGPAYHFARNMVTRAKKRKPSTCYYSGSNSDELINSLIYFIETCSNRRSEKQVRAVELYKKCGSQERVAEVLHLSTQSTVSSLLNNAFYYEIKNAEDNIINFLKTLL